MAVSWLDLNSLIRSLASRALLLFAASGIVPAIASENCAIDDASKVRYLNLDACRPAAISAIDKARILRMLPVDGAVTQFTAEQRNKLWAIDELLSAHARNGIYEVKIIKVPQAYMGLHERVVLLISKPALDLLTAEELEALAAHEVGHEYVWDQYTSAKVHGDMRRRRELELICDAIAVSTLIRLRISPARLESAIRRVESYNFEHLGNALDMDSYPPVPERAHLIKNMTSCP